MDDLPFDVEAADEEVVALVFQVLKERARVLPHQDRVRRVVVDAQLIADAVAFADAVQGDPRAGRVGDVVVKVVARRPAGHRALLNAVGQAARLRLLEQRDEVLFKVNQVLVHAQRLVATDEAAHGVNAQQRGGVEDAHHEVMFLLPDGRVMVQHVVEVAEVGDAYTVFAQGREHAAGALLVERLAQVERVGDRVEQGFGGDVGFRRVQRGGELNVVGADFAGELHPFLDGEIGVGVALLARRELLQRGGQHADLHEFWLERFDGHGLLLR